ncbi:MAG: hypothetical protein OXC18_21350 [Desulfurellaceae bacterium]|nr:hypothetical protein [Desulfurellaceae bacterium]
MGQKIHFTFPLTVESEEDLIPLILAYFAKRVGREENVTARCTARQIIRLIHHYAEERGGDIVT